MYKFRYRGAKISSRSAASRREREERSEWLMHQILIAVLFKR